MRLVKRLLLLGLLLAATLPLGSCSRAVERARERIRLEAVESVRRLGFSGAEAVVRVRNGSRSRLVLREADLEFFLGGRPVLSARLHRQVEVPRRTTERVVTRWRLQILDPMALPVLTGRLRAGGGLVPDPGARRSGAGKYFAGDDAVVGFFEYLWPDVAGRAKLSLK